MVPNNTNIFNIVESAVKDHENMMNSIITLVNDISRCAAKGGCQFAGSGERGKTDHQL